MEQIIGTHLAFFIIVSVIMAYGAILTADKMANAWRKHFDVYWYVFLIVLGHRFLAFALAGADILSVDGFLYSLIIYEAIGAIAFEHYRDSKIAKQYPWEVKN